MTVWHTSSMAVDAEGPTRTVLDAIGDTPLLELEGVWAKLEFLNPSGSIKARIASWIVDRAEREGLLRPGDTIVEASTGNTGNAFAMVAAVKGYRMVVVMPEGLSRERTVMSTAYGATVEFVGQFHAHEAEHRAIELGEQPGWFCPRQFDSEWNIDENEQWLGREILQQLPSHLFPVAIVAGVGTGGTLIGLAHAMRRVNHDVLTIAVEPEESCTISRGVVGYHAIEGIADGFVPGIIDRNIGTIDEVITVASEQALEEMQRLAAVYGLLVGPSSGANLIAAKLIRDRLGDDGAVITVFSDEGEKYLSQYWAPPPPPDDSLVR